MENKDWIVMIVPIIFNGIFIFLFQRKIEQKVDRQNIRQSLRDTVVKEFWIKLQRLNDTFVQTNIAIMYNPEVAGKSRDIFQEVILDIIQYYDKNQFDLRICEKAYKAFIDSWLAFNEMYMSFVGVELTESMQLQLGEKLQLVKDNNLKVIERVREKY